MYTIQYSYILYLYSILDSEETDPQNWKVISGYKYTFTAPGLIPRGKFSLYYTVIYFLNKQL